MVKHIAENPKMDIKKKKKEKKGQVYGVIFAVTELHWYFGKIWI